MNTPTNRLSSGSIVLTTDPDGEDFGLPLVSPVRRPGKGAEVREVRGTCRAQGGIVVWFTDGTKSRPLNGRTTWVSNGVIMDAQI